LGGWGGGGVSFFFGLGCEPPLTLNIAPPLPPPPTGRDANRTWEEGDIKVAEPDVNLFNCSTISLPPREL